MEEQKMKKKMMVLLLTLAVAAFAAGCTLTNESKNNDASSEETSVEESSSEASEEPEIISEPEESEEPESEPGESEEIVPAEPEESQEETADESGDGVVVSNSMYSVKLPSDWEENVYIDQGSSDPYIEFMLFAEKNDYENGTGGTLFEIALFQEDYSYLPSTEDLGTITSDETGESWQIVAMFPTDVQFIEENSELYNRMFDQIEDILATITPADGYTIY